MQHKIWLKMAHDLAEGFSKCVSKKVACLLVKDNRIIASGVNGTPKGYINCCDHFPNGWDETHHEWSLKYEVHAEQNAIADAAKRGISVDGAIAYTDLQPCFTCTKIMVAAGISEIYYQREYEYNDTKELHDFIEASKVRVAKVDCYG